jgi:hypothetical protein
MLQLPAVAAKAKPPSLLVSVKKTVVKSTPSPRTQGDAKGLKGGQSGTPALKRERPKIGIKKPEQLVKNDSGSAMKRQRSCPPRDAAAATEQLPKSGAGRPKSSSGKPTTAERHALQRQEMAIIMKSITNHGFDLKHVEPDGSCLFRALSLQVRPRGKISRPFVLLLTPCS